MADQVCRACRDGLCAECANWGAVEAWCDHLCREAPRQLSFDLGDDRKAGGRRWGRPATAGVPDDEEVPW